MALARLLLSSRWGFVFVCRQTDEGFRLQVRGKQWQVLFCFVFFARCAAPISSFFSGIADGRPRRSSRSQRRGYRGKCERKQGLFISPTQTTSCPAFCLVSAVLPSSFFLSPSYLFCILCDTLRALVLGSLKVTQAAGIWRRKRVNC